MLPAPPALRIRPVHAAVIVVASGPALHETFKRPMIAIGKKHGIPPFKMSLGFAVYIKNASHRETHLRREIKKGHSSRNGPWIVNVVVPIDCVSAAPMLEKKYALLYGLLSKTICYRDMRNQIADTLDDIGVSF